jgi:cytochrome b6-f complex iron-sulfur subunit
MNEFRVQGSGFRGRREFLRLCGCAAAGLAVSGCASVVSRPVTAVDGRISLSLADYPELRERNGSAMIQPQGMTDPLYVLNTGDRAYTVLSPICTHRGCTVEVAGTRLECPCHGSQYDRDGRVLRGPAERALTRFAATVQGDRLVIEVGRTS